MNDWKTVKPDALYAGEALERARAACSTAETARDRLKSAMRSHLATLDPVAHARHNEAQRGDAPKPDEVVDGASRWFDPRLQGVRITQESLDEMSRNQALRDERRDKFAQLYQCRPLPPPQLAPRATRSEESVTDLVAKVRWAINELDGQGPRSERIRNSLLLELARFEESY